MRALLLLFVLFISCNVQEKDPVFDQTNFYQFTNNRVAAEWEPAKGVMFTCPPVIPKELIIEFAKDCHIYPIVESKEEQSIAHSNFIEWGIDTNKIHFIALPKVNNDIAILRDWGPPAVFQKDGKMKLGDVDFFNSAVFSDLECNDSLDLYTYASSGEIYHSYYADSIIDQLALNISLKTLRVPITLTGGNVLVDGIGTAMSTCILLTENRFNGFSDERFFDISDSLMGYDNYHVISNFDEYGIQHIDCFLKILDEETILVAQPPSDHKLYEIYENIVNNELSQLKNKYGRSYKIIRMPIGRIVEEYLSAYTNSLILNKTVYVPLYSIASDSIAIEIWRSAMPGYTIKGIPFVIKDQPYLAKWFFEEYIEMGNVPGWAPDDAIHCRTRAIWDDEMIFISINKFPSEIQSDEEAIVFASIHDYNDPSLKIGEVNLYWRIKGSNLWNKETMKKNMSDHQQYARIPSPDKSTFIEYYVEAISKSGRSERRPMTAPKGFFESYYLSQ